MKLIFVTQRIDEAVSYAERRDALDQRWAVLLEKLGCAALPVPNHPKTAAALLERVRPDGILLTGGNDPASCGGNAPERDETDARLIEYSLDRSVPLFGVCRGCSRFCFISAARSNAYRAMWPYVTTFREQSAELSTATIIGAPGRRLQS